MNNIISIPDNELEETFKLFRKKKHIISRPISISILKKQKIWSVSFKFDSSSYQKTSSYIAVKPLLNFIKEKILAVDPSYNLNVKWEIVRIRD